MINRERHGGAGAGAACLLQLEHEDEAIDLVQRRVAAVRHQGSAAPRPVPSPCSPPSAEGRAPSTPAAMTWVERDVLRAVPVRPRILEPDVRPWPATAVALSQHASPLHRRPHLNSPPHVRPHRPTPSAPPTPPPSALPRRRRLALAVRPQPPPPRVGQGMRRRRLLRRHCPRPRRHNETTVGGGGCEL